MVFDTFEKVRESVYRCKTCGEEVPGGIFNLSSHWNKCTGKDSIYVYEGSFLYWQNGLLKIEVNKNLTK